MSDIELPPQTINVPEANKRIFPIGDEGLDFLYDEIGFTELPTELGWMLKNVHNEAVSPEGTISLSHTNVDHLIGGGPDRPHRYRPEMDRIIHGYRDAGGPELDEIPAARIVHNARVHWDELIDPRKGVPVYWWRLSRAAMLDDLETERTEGGVLLPKLQRAERDITASLMSSAVKEDFRVPY